MGTNKSNKPRKPGYKTKPFVHIPSHNTTVNPPGGLAKITQPKFSVKKRRGKEGQLILEMTREKW